MCWEGEIACLISLTDRQPLYNCDKCFGGNRWGLDGDGLCLQCNRKRVKAPSLFGTTERESARAGRGRGAVNKRARQCVGLSRCCGSNGWVVCFEPRSMAVLWPIVEPHERIGVIAEDNELVFTRRSRFLPGGC